MKVFQGYKDLHKNKSFVEKILLIYLHILELF